MKNKLLKCIKNYFFCKKYPFWKITDNWYCYNTGTDDKRIGSKKFFTVYSSTWYDDIPCGWQKAFGKQLSNDIKKAGLAYLEKHTDKTWADILSFQQIKEKWGELCLYASAERSIQKILDRYELLSIGYCINCGKPAKYKTKGWIEYYCKDCCLKDYHGWKKDANKEKDKEYLSECRLINKDIPVLYTYHKTLSGKLIKRRINLKKRYNIDFNKLWGIEE